MVIKSQEFVLILDRQSDDGGGGGGGGMEPKIVVVVLIKCVCVCMCVAQSDYSDERPLGRATPTNSAAPCLVSLLRKDTPTPCYHLV